MAIELNELLDGSRAYTMSDDGKNDSAVRKYHVIGTTSEIVAGSTVANSAPNTIVLPNLSVVRLKDIMVEPGRRDNVWEVTVNYANVPDQEEDDPDNPQPNLYSASFDTSGGAFHITQSFGTSKFPNDAEDFENSINVDKDNNVQGVDVVTPQLRIDRTVAYPRGYVSDAFIDVISDLTGKVNNGTFFGRESGEVLLLGAAGEDTGQPVVNISYSFLIKPNRTDVTVGTINIPNLRGHDYVWSRYGSKDGPNGKDRVSFVKAVYVEEIYPYGDFALLGIPGS